MCGHYRAEIFEFLPKMANAFASISLTVNINRCYGYLSQNFRELIFVCLYQCNLSCNFLKFSPPQLVKMPVNFEFSSRQKWHTLSEL